MEKHDINKLEQQSFSQQSNNQQNYNQLQFYQQTYQNGYMNPKKKAPIIIILILIIGCLMCCCCIGGVLITPSSKNKTEKIENSEKTIKEYDTHEEVKDNAVDNEQKHDNHEDNEDNKKTDNKETSNGATDSIPERLGYCLAEAYAMNMERMDGKEVKLSLDECNTIIDEIKQTSKEVLLNTELQYDPKYIKKVEEYEERLGIIREVTTTDSANNGSEQISIRFTGINHYEPLSSAKKNFTCNSNDIQTYVNIEHTFYDGDYNLYWIKLPAGTYKVVIDDSVKLYDDMYMCRIIKYNNAFDLKAYSDDYRGKIISDSPKRIEDIDVFTNDSEDDNKNYWEEYDTDNYEEYLFTNSNKEYTFSVTDNDVIELNAEDMILNSNGDFPVTFYKCD